MDYLEFDDYIELVNCDSFDIKQTLECGQVFRYKVRDFGYTVYSSDQKADIYCQNGHTKIFTKDKKYFIKYFDFCTNYDRIKSSLSVYPYLKPAIEHGKGIRILRGDLLEIIIEFIISQNNNIPRIKTIIERICESYGENMGDYFAFPTLDSLKSIPLEFFKKIGCGYRDKYLFDTISCLSYEYLDNLKLMSTIDARNSLLKLKGVGKKVADCILLFGLHKTDVFPTDTWIVKAYAKYYNSNESDAKKISCKLESEFGELSGYAQQYLFYQMRENS